MKILCIGDSLGLPRKGCLYEDTWLSLLRNRYPEHTFIGHFAGDRLIDSAAHDYDTYYQYYKPDIVIFQQGICDCAPRYVDEKKLSTRIARKMLYFLGFEKVYWRIVKSHSRKPDCVHTSPEKFVEVYKQMINKILANEGKYIVLIKIGHGAESVLAASPYFNMNADRYNALIDDIASCYSQVYVIDPLNVVKEDFFVDGYHCGASGMQKVCESLCGVLDGLGLK